MPSLLLRSHPVADWISQNSANRACFARPCRANHRPTVRCHGALPRHGDDLLAPGDRGGAGAGRGAMIVGSARWPCCVTLRPKVHHRVFTIVVADIEKKGCLRPMPCRPCVWWWFLVGITLIRDLKRLILLAKSFSASSCCCTTQRSPPIHRRQSTIFLDGKHDVREGAGSWADYQ